DLDCEAGFMASMYSFNCGLLSISSSILDFLFLLSFCFLNSLSFSSLACCLLSLSLSLSNASFFFSLNDFGTVGSTKDLATDTSILDVSMKDPSKYLTAFSASSAFLKPMKANLLDSPLKFLRSLTSVISPLVAKWSFKRSSVRYFGSPLIMIRDIANCLESV
ncbi:hypothetical protein WICPIJ_003344, partial [Wickerhamomyces pijperi]